jgi:hypothetical protein
MTPTPQTDRVRFVHQPGAGPLARPNLTRLTETLWQLATTCRPRKGDRERFDEILITIKRLHAAARLVPVKQDQVWIEAEIGDDWTLAYRVIQQDGVPVIGELRIFPARDDKTRHLPAGEWQGTHATTAPVPRGGISTRLLRKINTAADFAAGLKAQNRYVELLPAAAPRFTAAGFQGTKLKRRGSARGGGRRGWPDETLLDAALFYVTHGRHPVAALAKAWKLSPSQARDLLTAARRKGFLTSATQQGRTSRDLTDHAKELLAKRSQS